MSQLSRYQQSALDFETARTSVLSRILPVGGPEVHELADVCAQAPELAVLSDSGPPSSFLPHSLECVEVRLFSILRDSLPSCNIRGSPSHVLETEAKRPRSNLLVT